MIEKDSKDLVVALKSFARANSLPLDVYEVWDSLEEAKEYSKSPLAYPGQTLKIKMEDGKYHTFIIQFNENKELEVEKLPTNEELVPEIKDAIVKKHSHSNMDILETFTKTQEETDTAIKNVVNYVKQRIGNISKDVTLKDYIDTAISTGDAELIKAIAAALEEAKTHTDNSLIIYEF